MSSDYPLLPDRHPQGDFFVCDIFDAAPKADIGAMEHPIFSLSTKPDTRPRKYEHNGISIEVKPSSDGLATVHDRDVLIYCISQLIKGMNEGREPQQIVRFQASDLLKATNRMITGRGYDLLKAAMERLAGTRISTNITTGGQEVFETFGLIERARIVRETRDGRMQEVEIKLSDWVFNAIRAHEVLTLSREYFRLRKPLERRIYELARKHCGRQKEWRVSLELLQKKCGSGSSMREFRRLVTTIADEDEKYGHMPDYEIRFEVEKDVLVVRSRGTVGPEVSEIATVVIPPLDADVYAMAREAAPGWDVRMIEHEWRSWTTEAPKNPEMAFLGFCRKWFERRGRP
ncbi:replication initiator protein A (plasmid) [Gemmobacter fulvus]|uniref:Replication initiator protein A n=1 Tax=Gemmobacter fulvus TaxID=2840474 RepID=A0A975PC44_9RHOB|nr:replication initiator protein A [Gemmobacter fulvus]MBT9247909.1 replication initiator protein A [Gemmobacter fulvus]QWK93252.1 replication initiator protein A [Gemmobacter fulvus]